jgi:hypothetical protein
MSIVKLDKLREMVAYRAPLLSMGDGDKGTGHAFVSVSLPYAELSSFLKRNLVRAVYAPAYIGGSPGVTRKRYDQKGYYRQLKTSNPHISMTFRTSLPGYRTANVMYDLSPNLVYALDKMRHASHQALAVKTMAKVKAAMDEIAAAGYGKTLIVLETDPQSEGEDLNKALTPFSMFFLEAKKGLLHGAFPDGTVILLWSRSKRLLAKVTIGPKIVASKLTHLMSTMHQGHAEAVEVPEEDREPEPPAASHAVAQRVSAALGLDPKVQSLTGEQKDARAKIADAADKAGVAAAARKAAAPKPAPPALLQKPVKSVPVPAPKPVQAKAPAREPGAARPEGHPAPPQSHEPSEEEVHHELEGDKELADYLASVTAKTKRVVAPNPADEKKLADLRAMQGNTKFGDQKLSDVIAGYKSDKMETREIPVSTIDSAVRHSKLKDMDRSYLQNQYEKDLVASLTAFSNDPAHPIFVEKVEREDTSDEMNLKETMTTTFRDKDGGRHTFRVDLPLMVDHRFMYIGGNKKTMRKQLFPLPIVKTGPDEVKITTNYNRLFIYRFGQKADRHVWQLKKYLSGTKLPAGFEAKLGNAKESNKDGGHTVEFDEISSWLMSFETPGSVLFFDRARMREELGSLGVLDESWKAQGDYFDPAVEFPLGYDKSPRALLVVSIADGSVRRKTARGSAVATEVVAGSIVEAILGSIGPEATRDTYATPPGKSQAYSRVTVLGRKVPMVVMLGHMHGLTDVLKRAGIQWKFEDSSRRSTPEEKAGMEYVDFANGRMWYPSRPLRNRILLNGLSEADCEGTDFEEMDGPDVWMKAIESITGSRAAAKGLDNTAAMLIDPMTKDILHANSLPEDYAGLLLKANEMLETTDHRAMNDLTQYRVRGNEMLVAFTYSVLASSFKAFRDSRRSGGKDVKVTAPRDAVLRAINDSNVVSDYATLNPINEIEELSAISAKGPSGVNMDDAYTLEARAYDESMLGTLALNTPDSSSVGVVRHLSANPRIMDDRGLMAPAPDPEDLNYNEILSVAEALSPFTSTHADPPRIGMQVTQAKHVVPIKVQSRSLVGSGMEKALVHMIGSDFAAKAVQDGKVVEVDTVNGIMVVAYASETKDVIDLSSNIANNRGGGFYIVNRKEPMFKAGSSFKAGAVLAMNKSYFSSDEAGDPTFTVGKLTKVALMGGDFTIEDSSLVTESLRDDMSTNIVMKKPVPLGHSSNVDKIVRKGQHIKTGDTLISFDAAFEDIGANKLLAKIGQELGEAIEELGKNVVTSRYTGHVVDIRVYWNTPIEQMSESLQKIVNGYIASVKRREQKIRKTRTARDASPIAPVPLSQLPPNTKIGGQSFDGVIIEFFVEHELPLGVGDKIGFDTALKTIVSDVVPQEYFPYSESKKAEPIEAIVSPLSVITRMVTDVYSKMFLNKALLGLKERFGEALS